MYQTTNLKHKQENTSAMQTDIKREQLLNTDSLITTTKLHFYTDGTICREVKTETISAGRTQKPETVKTIQVNDEDKRKLMLWQFLLAVIFTLSYGPLAAFLVEMFPLKIRYTSMSLPYHVGYGIFGGMSLVIATYLIEKAQAANIVDYYLAGLNYPLVLMSISLVIGLLYLKENREGQPVAEMHSKNLNKVKRLMGIVWILLGLAAAWYGVFKLGIPKLSSGNKDDLIFGIIVMFFITPVAASGLLLFGKYALDGEYND
jgi:hypothetical protein